MNWNRRNQQEGTGGTAHKRRPKWPLLVMGSGASVTIWSGWVGLGKMTGFGEVHPLPGIWDSFRINTAITLPIGMEAYAAYAIGIWLDRTNPRRARTFAKWSSFAALGLGMAGQAEYHTLTASHRAAAPGWVVLAVACLPVLVVAFAALLNHLQGEENGTGQKDDAPRAGSPDGTEPAVAMKPLAHPVPSRPREPVPLAAPVPLAVEAPVPVAAGSVNINGTGSSPEPPAAAEPVPSRPPRKVASPPVSQPQIVGNRRVTLRDVSALLPRARELNDAWRAAHDRNIGADTLRQRMGIHKTTALALLREIRRAEDAGAGTRAG